LYALLLIVVLHKVYNQSQEGEFQSRNYCRATVESVVDAILSSYSVVPALSPWQDIQVSISLRDPIRESEKNQALFRGLDGVLHGKFLARKYESKT